jgi:hypothetical protein
MPFEVNASARGGKAEVASITPSKSSAMMAIRCCTADTAHASVVELSRSGPTVQLDGAFVTVTDAHPRTQAAICDQSQLAPGAPAPGANHFVDWSQVSRCAFLC